MLWVFKNTIPTHSHDCEHSGSNTAVDPHTASADGFAAVIMRLADVRRVIPGRPRLRERFLACASRARLRSVASCCPRVARM